MIRRVYVAETVSPGQSLEIIGEDGHHLARVLRLRVGETLSVASPSGVFGATVLAVEKASVRVQLGEAQPKRDPVTRTYLIQALAKGDKIETVIQKCTEVGAAGFLIVQSERSVVQLSTNKRSERLDRWRKVAREAASQSQRDVVPSVDFAADMAGIASWLTHLGDTHLLLLDEQEQQVGLKSALGIGTPGSHAIAIGPEGGWSDGERSAWQRLNATPVTLGPRILRTETAGLAALAAILFHHNDLGA